MRPSPARAPLRSRLWYLPLTLVFLVGAADSSGKGCSCKKDRDTGEVVDEVVETVQTVETPLQITSVEPARGEAGKAFTARVFGAGFERGAGVYFGGTQGIDAAVADANTIKVQVPAMPEGTYDVYVTNPDGTRATLRRGLQIVQTVPDCAFLRVYFEFDQARLVPDAEAAINGFVPCYQTATGGILVEGHTDERGTTEYNLALGQRRADATARHLTSRGIQSSRIQVVSFGEERPIDPSSNEAAWAKNRRADIHVGR